jgi:hypothetical protein
MREGETIYDYAWFPLMDSAEPASCWCAGVHSLFSHDAAWLALPATTPSTSGMRTRYEPCLAIRLILLGSAALLIHRIQPPGLELCIHRHVSSSGRERTRLLPCLQSSRFPSLLWLAALLVLVCHCPRIPRRHPHFPHGSPGQTGDRYKDNGCNLACVWNGSCIKRRSRGRKASFHASRSHRCLRVCLHAAPTPRLSGPLAPATLISPAQIL